MKKGKCIIVSAPSGAGKTSIVRRVLKNEDRLAFSISATSRSPRGGEINGLDYFFFSPEEFQSMVSRNEFIEWEEVYENQFYGTLKSELNRIWEGGQSVIFDVDVVGGSKLKKIFGDDALAIFVAPPDMAALEERLLKRSTETPESLKKRLEKAAFEMTFQKNFDYVLVNDVLPDACDQAVKMIGDFLDK